MAYAVSLTFSSNLTNSSKDQKTLHIFSALKGYSFNFPYKNYNLL